MLGSQGWLNWCNRKNKAKLKKEGWGRSLLSAVGFSLPPTGSESSWKRKLCRSTSNIPASLHIPNQNSALLFPPLSAPALWALPYQCLSHLFIYKYIYISIYIAFPLDLQARVFFTAARLLFGGFFVGTTRKENFKSPGSCDSADPSVQDCF